MAINTRHVALRNDAWRTDALHVKREYAKTRYDIPLFKLHELDPTKVRTFLRTVRSVMNIFNIGSSYVRGELYAER